MGELIKVGATGSLDLSVSSSLLPAKLQIARYLVGRLPELVARPIITAGETFLDIQTHLRLYKAERDFYVAIALPDRYARILARQLEVVHASNYPPAMRDHVISQMLAVVERYEQPILR